MGKEEFNKKKTKGVDIEAQKKKWKLNTTQQCDPNRYAVGKKSISEGNYYYEVKLLEVGGCYSSVGFCNEKTFKDNNCTTRLGDDSNGWAIRTYGPHTDERFMGLRSDGKTTSCFMHWETGDTIGALLDIPKKIIQFYRNGKKIDGAKFKKVKGKKFYPVVHICHSNKAVEVNFSPKYPKGVEKYKEGEEGEKVEGEEEKEDNKEEEKKEEKKKKKKKEEESDEEDSDDDEEEEKIEIKGKNYYKILELENGASKEEITKQYKKLARKYHPDICKEEGAEEKFKEIGSAYEILKDDKKREIYNKFGEDGLNGKQGTTNNQYGGGETDEPKKGKRSC